MEQYTKEEYIRLKQEFAAKEADMQARLWEDAQVAELDSLLRQNYNLPVKDFAEALLQHIARLTNSFQAVLYSVNPDEEKIQALAGYACKIEQLPQQQFKYGESVVGQVVYSQELMLFDDLPRKSAEASPTSVQLSPHTMLVLPFIFNEKAYGVVELVYLKALPEKHLSFLKRITQNVGAMLESTFNSLRMRLLLEDSKETNEALQAQEEELRQNMEEMAATQEAQRQTQEELEHLKEGLEEQVAKQTEALRRAMQRFDLASQTTTEGLWDLIMPDSAEIQDDTPFWWSDKLRHMLGYESEKDFPNVLSSWASLLHEADRDHTLEAFNNHLMDFTGRTPYDVEYRLQRKTGEYRWYRAVGNTVRNKGGKPLRVAGSLIDIQHEKDLIAEKERLQEITADLPGMIYQYELNPVTGETSFPFVSHRSLYLFGLGADEVAESKGEVLDVHPDDNERLQKVLEESAKSLSSFSLQMRLRVASGEFEWVRSDASPIKLANGNIRWSGYMQNVDAFVKERKQKIYKEKQAAQVFNHFTGAILILSHRGEILDINPKAKEILNLEEMRTSKGLKIKKFFRHIRLERLKSNRSYRQKLYPHNSEETRLVELRATEYEFEGELQRIFFVSDITDAVLRDQEKIALIEELNKEKIKLAKELAQLKQAKE